MMIFIYLFIYNRRQPCAPYYKDTVTKKHYKDKNREFKRKNFKKEEIYN